MMNIPENDNLYLLECSISRLNLNCEPDELKNLNIEIDFCQLVSFNVKENREQEFTINEDCEVCRNNFMRKSFGSNSATDLDRNFSNAGSYVLFFKRPDEFSNNIQKFPLVIKLQGENSDGFVGGAKFKLDPDLLKTKTYEEFFQRLPSATVGKTVPVNNKDILVGDIKFFMRIVCIESKVARANGCENAGELSMEQSICSTCSTATVHGEPNDENDLQSAKSAVQNLKVSHDNSLIFLPKTMSGQSTPNRLAGDANKAKLDKPPSENQKTDRAEGHQNCCNFNEYKLCLNNRICSFCEKNTKCNTLAHNLLRNFKLVVINGNYDPCKKCNGGILQKKCAENVRRNDKKSSQPVKTDKKKSVKKF